MRLAVVTVTYESSHLVEGFLAKLRSDGSDDCEVIVVDSGSSDSQRSKDMALRAGATFSPSETNVGYGTGSNIGAALASSEWLFFVNPDVEVTMAALRELVTIAEERGVACIGPVIEEPNGSIRRTWGRTVTPPWRKRGSGWREEEGLIVAETISGCCMGIRKRDFEALGGFDERFFLFSEEMDLHRRMANAGMTTACATAIHASTPGGGSSDGVSSRWRLSERAVGHTNFMFKHFTRAEGMVAVLYNLSRIILDSSFSPRTESFAQYWHGIRRNP
jgi:GT2 family glycosyltransferase